jgi:hypothetical protein
LTTKLTGPTTKVSVAAAWATLMPTPTLANTSNGNNKDDDNDGGSDRATKGVALDSIRAPL